MLVRLAMVLISVLLTCGALEVGLRLVWERPTLEVRGPEWGKYFHPDERFPRRAMPNPNVCGVDRIFNTTFTTNSRGLRGKREYAIPAPPGVRRIVALGDSFTWGFGVNDDEVYTEHLSRNLPATEVVNLGVSGFDLRSELTYLQDEGMRYQPQAVLLAVCQNDICWHRPVVAQPAPSLAAAAGPTMRPPRNAFQRLKAGLFEHCRLYALVIEAINSRKELALAAVRIGLKDELGGFELLDYSLRPALRNPPERMQRAWSQFGPDLLAIRDYLRERDVTLVLTLIPARQTLDRANFMRSIAYTKYADSDFDLDEPYRRIERFAREHGIAVCNPLEVFRERIADGEELYLPNDMHFGPAGHRLFAEQIAAALESLDPRRDPPSARPAIALHGSAAATVP